MSSELSSRTQQGPGTAEEQVIDMLEEQDLVSEEVKACVFCKKVFQPGESFCSVLHNGVAQNFHLGCFRCCRCRVGIGRGSYHVLPSMDDAEEKMPSSATPDGAVVSKAKAPSAASQKAFTDMKFLCKSCVPRCPACMDPLLGALTCFTINELLGEIKLHSECFRCFLCLNKIAKSYTKVDFAKCTNVARKQIEANLQQDIGLERLREKMWRSEFFKDQSSSNEGGALVASAKQDARKAIICELCVPHVYPKKQCYFCLEEILHDMTKGVRSMRIDKAMDCFRLEDYHEQQQLQLLQQRRQLSRKVGFSGRGRAGDHGVEAEEVGGRPAEGTAAGAAEEEQELLLCTPTEQQTETRRTSQNHFQAALGDLESESHSFTVVSARQSQSPLPAFGPEWEKLEVQEQITTPTVPAANVDVDKDYAAAGTTSTSTSSRPRLDAQPAHLTDDALLQNFTIRREDLKSKRKPEMATVFFHGHCFKCVQCDNEIVNSKKFLQMGRYEFLCSDCFPTCVRCKETLVGEKSCTIPLGVVPTSSSLVTSSGPLQQALALPAGGSSGENVNNKSTASASLQQHSIILHQRCFCCDLCQKQIDSEETSTGNNINSGHFTFDSSYFEDSPAAREFYRKWNISKQSRTKANDTSYPANNRTLPDGETTVACPSCYKGLMQEKEKFVCDFLMEEEFKKRRKLEEKNGIFQWDERLLKPDCTHALRQILEFEESSGSFTKTSTMKSNQAAHASVLAGVDETNNHLKLLLEQVFHDQEREAEVGKMAQPTVHQPKRFCVFYEEAIPGARKERISLVPIKQNPPLEAQTNSGVKDPADPFTFSTSSSGSSDLYSVNLQYFFLSLKMLRENHEPFFSLDPADPTDLMGKLQKKRFHPEWLADTLMGEVLFQADYFLKQFSFGEITNSSTASAEQRKHSYKIPLLPPELFKGSPVLKSREMGGTGITINKKSGNNNREDPQMKLQEDVNAEAASSSSSTASRQWFVLDEAQVVQVARPEEITEEEAENMLKEASKRTKELYRESNAANKTKDQEPSASSGFLLVPRVRLRVEARRLTRDPETNTYKDAKFTSSKDPAVLQAKFFTEKFPQIAAKVPVVAELIEVARALTLAKWILEKKEFQIVNGEKLDLLAPQRVSTRMKFPKSVVVEGSAGSFVSAGGVVGRDENMMKLKPGRSTFSTRNSKGNQARNKTKALQDVDRLYLHREHEKSNSGAFEGRRVANTVRNDSLVFEDEEDQTGPPEKVTAPEDFALGRKARNGESEEQRPPPGEKNNKSAAVISRESLQLLKATDHLSRPGEQEPVAAVSNRSCTQPAGVLEQVQGDLSKDGSIIFPPPQQQRLSADQRTVNPPSTPGAGSTTATNQDDGGNTTNLEDGGATYEGATSGTESTVSGVVHHPSSCSTNADIMNKINSITTNDFRVPHSDNSAACPSANRSRNKKSSSPTSRSRRKAAVEKKAALSPARAEINNEFRPATTMSAGSSSIHSNSSSAPQLPPRTLGFTAESMANLVLGADRGGVTTTGVNVTPGGILASPSSNAMNSSPRRRRETISRTDVLRKQTDANALEDMMLQTRFLHGGSRTDNKHKAGANTSSNSPSPRRSPVRGGVETNAMTRTSRAGAHFFTEGSHNSPEPRRRTAEQEDDHEKLISDNSSTPGSISEQDEQESDRHNFYPMFIPTLAKRTLSSKVDYDNGVLSVEHNTVHMYGGVDLGSFPAAKIDETFVQGVDLSMHRGKEIDEAVVQGVDLSLSPDRKNNGTRNLLAKEEKDLVLSPTTSSTSRQEEQQQKILREKTSYQNRKSRIRLGWIHGTTGSLSRNLETANKDKNLLSAILSQNVEQAESLWGNAPIHFGNDSSSGSSSSSALSAERTASSCENNRISLEHLLATGGPGVGGTRRRR
ncbi:unnamed protein product [Amoebophrya sp. A120]|nr:unnamed protein product [Amoebophrya sp. A120]|eukprot:GSA120T00009433001.1